MENNREYIFEHIKWRHPLINYKICYISDKQIIITYMGINKKIYHCIDKENNKLYYICHRGSEKIYVTDIMDDLKTKCGDDIDDENIEKSILYLFVKYAGLK
jgi:hypothetical protein